MGKKRTGMMYIYLVGFVLFVVTVCMFLRIIQFRKAIKWTSVLECTRTFTG